MDLEIQKKGDPYSRHPTVNIEEIRPQIDNPLLRHVHNTQGRRSPTSARHIAEFRTLSIHVDDDKESRRTSSSHDRYLGKHKVTVEGE